MSELPENWEWSTIGQIGTVASGGTPSTERSDYYDGEIPWITPKDLSGYTEKFISGGSRSITKEGLANSSAKILPKGTVLFSSRAPIGYCVIATNAVATNQGFKNLIPDDRVLADYVYHYLKGNKQLAEKHASGTTFLEISGKAFSKLPIPLPPLPEQRRIVARIEELFSRLDAGVAALRHAKAQLQRYRQAVLAAAVTGHLTQAWREQKVAEASRLSSPDKNQRQDASATLPYEPAEKLLERILEQRREQWDGRRKYKEPVAPVVEGLPEIPATWTWSSPAQLSGVRLKVCPEKSCGSRNFDSAFCGKAVIWGCRCKHPTLSTPRTSRSWRPSSPTPRYGRSSPGWPGCAATTILPAA